MKNKSLIIFFVFLLGSLSAYAQTQNKEIFRYIDLGRDRRISLGQEFSNIDDLFVKTETGYQSKPNTFEAKVANNISFVLTIDNKIKAIYFDFYWDEQTFEQKIANYTKSLGSPKGRISLDSNSIKVEIVYWEDKQTRFEIVKKNEREKISFSAGMFDKKSK
jgi:hypothetical protein